MRNAAALTCVLILMMIVVITQSSTYSIDLVDSPETTDEEYREASRLAGRLYFSPLARGSYEGWSPPSVPLTVSLLSPDGGIYYAGDEITYEFVVRNTGSDPVYVPTSRQGHLFTVQMPRATRALFGLKFEDEVLGSQSIGVQGTFGAESVGNSLLLLRQHESVTIRANGAILIQSTGNPAKPYPWLRVVNARISFGLYPVEGEPFGEVMSANSVAIELRSSPE